MTMPLGKHSGRHAFARACAERGVDLAGEELDGAFRRFKERADAGGDRHARGGFRGGAAHEPARQPSHV